MKKTMKVPSKPRGQGLTEYIVIVALVAIAAIGIVNIFGNQLRQTAIGEESGALDDMLAKVAEFYEREVDDAVDNMTALMEPLIMVVLGGLIGTLVIAMYLPIFKLGAVI